jgi:hypothetical protein
MAFLQPRECPTAIARNQLLSTKHRQKGPTSPTVPSLAVDEARDVLVSPFGQPL